MRLGRILLPSACCNLRDAGQASCLTVRWCAAQIVYYDGQFDDSRLNVSLACTAALAGAAVLNYAEVVELLKAFSRPCPVTHQCISASSVMHVYPELPAL